MSDSRKKISKAIYSQPNLLVERRDYGEKRKNKTARMEFRCTQEEKKYLQSKAKLAAPDVTVSEFLRRLVIKGETENEILAASIVKKLVRELDWEMSKIGTNINQIAKMCNMKNYVSKSDLEELRKEIQELNFLF